jgi:hypothetical protein
LNSMLCSENFSEALYSGSRNCPHVLTFFTIYDIVWESTNVSRTR